MKSTFEFAIVLKNIVYTTSAADIIANALGDAGVDCRIMDAHDWEVVYHDGFDSSEQTIIEEEE